jgi:hypothetical protein
MTVADALDFFQKIKMFISFSSAIRIYNIVWDYFFTNTCMSSVDVRLRGPEDSDEECTA